MDGERLTVSLLSDREEALTATYANEKEKDISTSSTSSDTTMASSTLQEDEPDSDDQEMRCNTPLTLKPGVKVDGDISSGTLLTSPTSSRKSYTYLNDSSIAFNDNVTYFEIDCEYTDAQVSQLWFTKTEYDEFLQACDEDAQKCEAHEQETRVAKVKKEIKKAQRQKRRKEKRNQKLNNQSRGGMDSVLDSTELDMDDDIIDDSLDEETVHQEEKPEMNEDEQGWLCSLGLEAWTLEGYQIREHHRQKAVDAVLNEQYAAWDNGKVENSEMMSALYFAASASSKLSASKKGKELEVDVQEYTLVSTLEDYNRAVQTLNVLQKSLHCIKSKKENENNRRNSRRESRSDRWKTGTARRGSNASTESVGASSFIERALAPANEHENEVSEDALMSTIVPDPKLSTIKINSSKKKGPPLSASSSCRKKITGGTPKKMYRSKAGTNFQVAPPTPPVVKARRIEYKPAMAPAPSDMLDPPVFKSPKNRKVVYKSQPPKHASTKSSSGDAKIVKSNKKKREKESQRELRRESQRELRKEQKEKEKVRSERVRSKSPRPVSLSSNTTETTIRSTKTPRRVSLSTSNTETTTRRSKSPRPVSTSTTKSPRDSSAKRDSIPQKHSKSKSPRRIVTKSVVSKAPKIDISVSSDTSSSLEVSSSSHTAHMSTRKSKKKHKRDKHNDDEKEHWWFQQQKEAAACQ